LKSSKKFNELLKLVYLRQKNFKKKHLKKVTLKKMKYYKNDHFCAEKIHKNLKKCIENKNCSPTRVLAADRQGL